MCSSDLRPDPIDVAAVRDTARLLTDLGHDVREIDPHYPDPTTAFVPQFFAGIRSEADAVEHFDRLERTTRQTYRMGSWVTPRVRDWAIKQGGAVAVKANRIFDAVDVLLTPTLGTRPPRVGQLDGRLFGAGTLAMSLRSMPMIAYAALWNVAGNPAAAVPVGVGPDGLPLSVQFVGPTDGEPLLLSLSAQVEAAQPWQRLAPA